MSDSILFYTPVDKKVQDKLNTRKNYYKSEDRSSGAHAWLFQKMAWATAQAYNESTGKSKAISIPQRGGLGKLGKGDISSGGMYKNAIKPTGAYPISGRFTPKPHINSVKITNEGDLGSLVKSEVSFAVYSLSDLNLCQPFFDIGAKLAIQYGWNDAGQAGGSTGNFEGTIYNFTYSVNSEGGFDCISYGMAAGINTLTGDIKAGSDSAGRKTTDATGNEIEAGSIIGEIDVLVASATTLGHSAINADGIGAIMYPTSWGSSAELAPATVVESDTPHYYISLEKLVEIINNKVLRAAGGDKFNKLVIKCNSDITKGSMPAVDKLVSGNPLQVLFPGFGNYGTHNLFSTDFVTEMQKGDLSKTMINISWLLEMLKTMGTLTVSQQKSANNSVGKFLQNILDSIHINSGTRFKLSIVSNPKDDTEVLITDPDYIDAAVEAYPITAVTEDSICRSISLTSKVPDLLATGAYIGNTNTLASMGAGPGSANGTIIKKAAPPPAPIPVKPAQTPPQILVLAPTGSTTPVLTVGNLLGTTPLPNTTAPITSTFPPGTPEYQLDIAKKNIDAVMLGPTSNNVNALQAALKRMYTEGSNADGTNRIKETIPFPIDFSCTLDGIEGFICGNAITCNYLPTVYTQKTKVAFTIFRIEHTIAGNDWTTSLSTLCRFLPSTY